MRPMCRAVVLARQALIFADHCLTAHPDIGRAHAERLLTSSCLRFEDEVSATDDDPSHRSVVATAT